MTFEIKVSTNPENRPLKLRISEHEDKNMTVHNFCQVYKINKDREQIIRNEVVRYFEMKIKERADQ